jgi:hypothetical protein
MELHRGRDVPAQSSHDDHYELHVHDVHDVHDVDDVDDGATEFDDHDHQAGSSSTGLLLAYASIVTLLGGLLLLIKRTFRPERG